VQCVQHIQPCGTRKIGAALPRTPQRNIHNRQLERCFFDQQQCSIKRLGTDDLEAKIGQRRRRTSQRIRIILG
jgi:hypothetical protein